MRLFINHTVNFGIDDVKEILIPPLDEEVKLRLKGLVAEITDKQKQDSRYPYHLHEQKEIDALVYELYGLSEDDIREVTLWYCRRYHTLASAQGVVAEVHEKYQNYLDRAREILNKPASYWRSHPLLTRIAADENDHTEFKEFLAIDMQGNKSSDSRRQVAAAVASFANAGGGLLLIGVTNSGKVVGIDRDLAHVNRGNHDGFELKLREILEAHLRPVPVGAVAVSFEPLPDGTVCAVTVQPTPTIVYCEDVVYQRNGGKKRKVEGRELVDWAARRSSPSP